MNRTKMGWLVVASLALSAGGCKKDEAPQAASSASAAKSAAPAESSGREVGDVVVGRWASGSFYEGKIQSINGSRANIAWSDNSKPQDVDMADVFALPKAGAKPDVKVGDFALVRRSSGTYWSGAEITSVADGAIGVKYTSDGTTGTLGPEKVIKATPAIAANLKKDAAKSEFLAKAKAAGSPVKPKGWKPKKGDAVVGVWSVERWYAGKVQAIAGDKATIEWADGSKPSEVAFDKIAPTTGAAMSKMPKVGGYVLVKPTSGAAWAWGRADKVERDSITASLAEGGTRTLKVGDFLTLE